MKSPCSRTVLAALLLAAAALPGCVHRKLMIRSDPPGAAVYLNGAPVGTAPVEVPFSFYGTVRIEADALDADGDGFIDHRGAVTSHDLETPWYQWFPIDFFAENVWPLPITDEHEALVVLEALPDVTDEAATEQLRREAVDLRRRADDERTRIRVDAGLDVPPPPDEAPPPDGE